MPQKIKIADIVVNRTTPVADEDVEAMAKDIAANGLRQPIIIDRYGLLIDGLLRLCALQQLGIRTVDAFVAQNLQEAVELLRDLNFNPFKLSLRRRRDFGESLDPLISAQIRLNLTSRSNKSRPLVKPRELVATVLGYPWHRIRRVFRWLEEDPKDPERQEYLRALENGEISAHKLYLKIGGTIQKRRIPAAREFQVVGDITFPKDQIHLLTEVNRQLSGIIKSSTKLSFPLNITAEQFEPLLDQLTRHRSNLNKFINNLRKEAPPQ